MINLADLERIAREEFADIVVDVYRIDAKKLLKNWRKGNLT